ncbi:MAG: hypothetical protein WKF97_20125 [Chitinophagaceae bacterium]
MKYTIKQSDMLSILLCLTISFLFSCKKEKEEAILQPLIEETINIKSSPLVAESPALGEKVEETSASLFPNKALASASTAAIGTTDFVDFNDEMALTIIPDYAASTFATAPFYIQQVGSAWVHVKENNSGNYKLAFKSNYGHYHLSYQNFVPCITQNGQFGKPVGGGCAGINPVKEPRILDTHDGYQWIKIYAYDYSNPSRVFDLLGIKVTKGPIQLWFKKSNGDWYHWSSIGVGTWNLSAYSTSIKEVLISSTGNNGPVGFDNVKVLVPDF